VVRYFQVFIIFFALMIGCDDNSLEDKLLIDVEPANTIVAVDSACAAEGCFAIEELGFTVSFDAEEYIPSGSEVTFSQYRIDYDFADSNLEIPFFAAALDLEVSVQYPGTAVVYAAGSSQRNYVYHAVGGKQVKGTALLTLAGYDSEDMLVVVETSFEISFGDF
jgi:hypothetical protein